MDAVELVLPQAAVVSKFMGSEGLGVGGGVGVSVAKVQASHSGCNSVEIRSSVDVDACSGRDKIPASNATGPGFWGKTPDAEYFIHRGQPTIFHGVDHFEDFNLERKDGSISLMTGLDSKQLHRRIGKVARSNSGGSKRSRSVHIEASVNEFPVEDSKSYSAGIGSSAVKSVVAEKMQMPRQKNNANGKRGDKRTGRIPKSRCDTFSLKNGLVSFSAVAGGGNIPVYGSKCSNFDVSKHIDELPINELLDGSYKCPSSVKGKEKGVENSNDSFLSSVRKACSVIRLRSPIHAQDSAEKDNNYSQKVSAGTISTDASPVSGNDVGNGDPCSVDQPSADKLSFEDESCARVNTLASPVELPLCSPKDILERLSLPPSKDLDSLLLDAAKSASSSRNNSDVRLGKTASNRTGLPPFPWSHNFSGHSKSGPDAVKVSATRTTCQGRWVKLKNGLTPLKDSIDFLVDWDSLKYDHGLVPTENEESGPSKSANFITSHAHFTFSERILSSSVASSVSQVPQGVHSPELSAAAETLCEIAGCTLKQNSIGMMKLLKRPSQKTMKACKLKLHEKSQRLIPAPKPSEGPDKVADGVLASKKPRLSMDAKAKDDCHTNPAIKGMMSWPSSRSIRPSPSKPFRDPVSESKSCHRNTVKKPYMMPPPARVMDKAFCNQQKPKKMALMEWSPTASKLG